MNSVTVHAGGMTITSERGSIDLTREAVRQLYLQGKRWAEDDEIPNQSRNLQEECNQRHKIAYLSKLLKLLTACGIDLTEEQLMDETVFDAVVNRVRELCSSEKSKSSGLMEAEAELQRARTQLHDYVTDNARKTKRISSLEGDLCRAKLELDNERALVAKLQAVKPLVDVVDALKSVLNK